VDGSTLADDSSALGDRPLFFVTVLVMWLVAGLGAALHLRRRGHDAGPAVAIGIVLGPFLIPLARRILARGRAAEARVIWPEGAAKPQVDTLVVAADAATLAHSAAVERLGWSRAAAHEPPGDGRVAFGVFVDRDSLLTDAPWSPRTRDVAATLVGLCRPPSDAEVDGGTSRDAIAMLLPAPASDAYLRDLARREGIGTVLSVDASGEAAIVVPDDAPDRA
jgi:hypothetical protein